MLGTFVLIWQEGRSRCVTAAWGAIFCTGQFHRISLDFTRFSLFRLSDGQWLIIK